MATVIRGSDNFDTADNATQTELDAKATLSHNGSTKLATTSTGIDVTGNVNGLQITTTATSNLGLGSGAVDAITTGDYNVGLGDNALTAVTDGSSNTAIGYDALQVATGGYNTAIGQDSGSAITTGTNNTILGSYNGNQGGLDIRAASNYIVLSDGDGNPSGYHNGSAWYLRGSGSTARALITNQTASVETMDIGLVGGSNNTSGQASTTKTFELRGDGSLFYIVTSDGRIGIYAAEYVSTTITEIRSHPSIELTSTPSANHLGVYTAANDSTISAYQDGTPPFGAYYVNILGR